MPRLLRRGNLRDQYDFHPSGLVVFSCADPDWPVLFQAGEGDTHRFSASPDTIRRLIGVLRDHVPPLEAARRRMPRRWGLFPPRPHLSCIEVGDDIRVTFERGRWGIQKKGLWMGVHRLHTAELQALADVLAHLIGADRPGSDDSVEDESGDSPAILSSRQK
ncbi:hypothetical protein [Thetidibacter halocola]|uniref:Uncharacterized protein n=1 Tax=Thetidibacter halocola TaxID=2827239 RepID=A0A8J7WAC1_9RHOB|nr:hypothetical protein [Thetidibacter halocola]MBS0122849.1 hypothetical protein [Thetidibacter halocola]